MKKRCGRKFDPFSVVCASCTNYERCEKIKELEKAKRTKTKKINLEKVLPLA